MQPPSQTKPMSQSPDAARLSLWTGHPDRTDQVRLQSGRTDGLDAAKGPPLSPTTGAYEEKTTESVAHMFLTKLKRGPYGGYQIRNAHKRLELHMADTERERPDHPPHPEHPPHPPHPEPGRKPPRPPGGPYG